MKPQWIALAMSGLVAIAPVAAIQASAESNSLTQLFPALVGIQLKPVQQTQLEQLSQQTLPKVRRVLSPEQLTKFNAALAQGQSVRGALAALNLSISQKFNLRNEMQSMRSQLNQVLTPEQQRQVKKNARSLPKGL
jgi:LTXXQ motif family protein